MTKKYVQNPEKETKNKKTVEAVGNTVKGKVHYGAGHDGP
jgi:hypothetical protein